MGKTYRREAPHKKQENVGHKHPNHDHERMEVKQKIRRIAENWRDLNDDDDGDQGED